MEANNIYKLLKNIDAHFITQRWNNLLHTHPQNIQ